MPCKTDSIYIEGFIISCATRSETLKINGAFNPIKRDTPAKATTGKIKATFPELTKGAKWSISSLLGLGRSFQNTSDQIRATINKVTKLAKINVPNKTYCSNRNASWNNMILGQNPDKGGIPTKENRITANKMDNFG